LRARRPIARLIRRQSATNRIDSKCKKLIERRVKAAQAKGPLAQKVPVKGFDVAEIKNNAMPFGNGPFVERFVAQDFE